jgi:hypothetical protein
MTIPACDRPLATTTQFRAAVRRILGTTPWSPKSGGYTDRPPRQRSLVDNGHRYVLCYTGSPTEKDIEAIEFVLWAQGVTAKTRGCSVGVRGNCVMPSNLKEKQNV